MPGQASIDRSGERWWRRMRVVKRFKFGPLFGFKCVSLLGFTFFDICLLIVWIYSKETNAFLAEKFKTKLANFSVFIILASINSCCLLITFIQLSFSKPTSKKILIPIVIFTVTTFLILIALDFYLEVELSHETPKEALTKSPEMKGKKGKARSKMGYLVIYICLCIVGGFMYLSFKDYEDYLERQKRENEEPREIVISHIT